MMTVETIELWLFEGDQKDSIFLTLEDGQVTYRYGHKRGSFGSGITLEEHRSLTVILEAVTLTQPASVVDWLKYQANQAGLSPRHRKADKRHPARLLFAQPDWLATLSRHLEQVGNNLDADALSADGGPVLDQMQPAAHPRNKELCFQA